MTAADCLKLRHQSQRRRRFSLRSSQPIDWAALASVLDQRLDGTPFRFRLNPLASTVILWGNGDVQEKSWQRPMVALVAALEELGVTPPPPKVINIPLRDISPSPHINGSASSLLRSLVYDMTNLMTVTLGLLLTLSAFSLLVVGLPALLLPLSPGTMLLLAAAWLMELAFLLRRPFTASAI